MKFVRILVCIVEVRGLNLDRKPTVLAQIFFCSCLQSNYGMTPVFRAQYTLLTT
jgi:hypothetical protein